MNSFATLFFPETDIFNERHYPLLLFFTPLHFLQVVEPALGPVINPEAELFLKSGLCQAHIPAPLEDNREQFLRLIRDVGGQKEHPVAQLSGLINDLNAAPAGSKHMNFKHKIISSLLRKYGVKHATSRNDLQLWQARLVLAIAEILDSSEEALREQLFFFSEDEIATFHSLQGAPDQNEQDPFSELENIKAGLEKSRFGNIAKRLESWLVLMRKQPIPPVQAWLASTRDSADHIINGYESTADAHVVPLLKLALPAHFVASDQYVVKQINEFQQATIHIHRGLVADFERIVRTVPYLRDRYESLLPYDTDWADQWEGALHDCFPASNYGRNDVTFYLLPDTAISRLLSLSESLVAAHGDAAHGLLAILGTPQYE